MSLGLFQPAPWTKDAACIGSSTDVFFPPKEPATNRADIAAAKAICASCPVRADCLEHALALPEVYGLWGGLTTQERREPRMEWLRRHGKLREDAA